MRWFLDVAVTSLQLKSDPVRGMQFIASLTVTRDGSGVIEVPVTRDLFFKLQESFGTGTTAPARLAVEWKTLDP